MQTEANRGSEEEAKEERKGREREKREEEKRERKKKKERDREPAFYRIRHIGFFSTAQNESRGFLQTKLVFEKKRNHFDEIVIIVYSN